MADRTNCAPGMCERRSACMDTACPEHPNPHQAEPEATDTGDWIFWTLATCAFLIFILAAYLASGDIPHLKGIL